MQYAMMIQIKLTPVSSTYETTVKGCDVQIFTINTIITVISANIRSLICQKEIVNIYKCVFQT